MMRLAVVGATGLVGRTFLKVLEERNLPIGKITLFASSRSAGSAVKFMGEEHIVQKLDENSFDEGFDYALFSAGGSISGIFAPIAAAKGCVVIDNSSRWRMDADAPLVVPEVNPRDAEKPIKNIIANPNCSTIQSVVALKPLHDKYGIKRVIYNTYQSVSGAGAAGCADLENGLKGEPPKKFVHPIAGNCIPHIGSFCENGYTDEEIKMITETRKILHAPGMRVSATCVRVPVPVGHGVSMNIELENAYDLDELIALLKASPGIVVRNNSERNEYPLAADAAGKDGVFVGRIRRDESAENGLEMWCVADNVRKGAATNAIQILELLVRGQ